MIFYIIEQIDTILLYIFLFSILIIYMIAPSTNFDMNVMQPTKSPAIVKKPVSFFNTQPTPQQEQPSTPQPPKQQPTPQPAQPPKQQPTQPTQQQPVQVENTTELEEMHIGLNEFMEGAPKPKKRSDKQLAHLAKMREQKALKREQTKSTHVPPQTPSAPQQSSNMPVLYQHDFSTMFKQHFEQHYSEKEAIKQREKAIRQEAKQKVLSKLMAQQKLTAQAPAPTPAPTPAPKPVESTAGKKLRYKMSPFGGIHTYYE